jgi:hypothetical protein
MDNPVIFLVISAFVAFGAVLGWATWRTRQL